jgi:hypothetical protein
MFYYTAGLAVANVQLSNKEMTCRICNYLDFLGKDPSEFRGNKNRAGHVGFVAPAARRQGFVLRAIFSQSNRAGGTPALRNAGK